MIHSGGCPILVGMAVVALFTTGNMICMFFTGPDVAAGAMATSTLRWCSFKNASNMTGFAFYQYMGTLKRVTGRKMIKSC